MRPGGAEGARSRLTSYGDDGFSAYLRGAFLAAAGYDRTDLDRPIVGIGHTISDFTPCHRQMPELVEAVKRGVLQSGGLPMVFPTTSLGETLLSPTSMLFRNLAAMETEEMITAQPMDAVVLLGGCDKTVPAHLMAAISADVPALQVVAGPMITGSWRGARLGACTDCRQHWARYRAGELTDAEITEVEGQLCPTAGTCMVMGTASSMACMTETLGMMLPGGATAPAPTGDRLRHATASGRRAVELARARVRPSDVLSRDSFLNAVTVLAALGGSTNGIVHLVAAARRARVDVTLGDIGRIAAAVPLLVDLKPSGLQYMEDFHRAGGVPVLLRALAPLLRPDARTADGRTVGDVIAEAGDPAPWQTVIGTLDRPIGPPGALAVLTGSLAPGGAVLKVSAASPELLQHRGPAVVFDSPADVAQRIDDPALGITGDHVMVLRNAGPVAAGMPEAGSFPIPRALAARGVKDMVRISDARMSGTSYGTVVLHATPEAAVGGPLALVRDGDLIELDVRGRPAGSARRRGGTGAATGRVGAAGGAGPRLATVVCRTRRRSRRRRRSGLPVTDDLTGRTVAITGGNRGIGRAVAGRFAAAGARVAVGVRDPAALSAVRADFAADSQDVLVAPCEVTDEGSVAQFRAAVRRRFGPAEVVIANAGVAGPVAPLHEIPVEAWRDCIDVDLTGVYLVFRAFIPDMIARRGGSLIAISSVTGKRPLAHRTPYAAAKMGVIGLVRSLALELGPYGIRANTVCPGSVDGPRMDAVFEAAARARGITAEAARREDSRSAALGRLVRAAEVADLCAFLAAGSASAITGEDLNVSAGSVMY